MDYYLRSPVMSEKDGRIYLISQQSLWLLSDGNLTRLCSFVCEVKHLRISPNGEFLSFVGRENSNGDIYVYSIKSGHVYRASYFDDPAMQNIAIDDSRTVTLASAVNSPFSEASIYKIDNTRIVEKLKYRDASWISLNEDKILLQRFGYGYHSWLNYKGGLAARVFYGKDSDLKELRLPENNCCKPFFFGDRVFFWSDIDGRYNLYEYDLKEETYIQKTFNQEFSARDYSACNDKVLYSCGGDIYEYSINEDKVKKITVSINDYSYESGDFVSASLAQYVTGCAINESGEELALAARGHTFSCKLWDRVFSKNTDSIRYRLVEFLSNKELLRIKDSFSESVIEKFCLNTLKIISSVTVKTGRVSNFKIKDEKSIVTENTKGELILINIENGESETIIRGKSNKIHGFDISSCGEWLAYSVESLNDFTSIYLYNFSSKIHYKITSDGHAYSPSFSADLNYIFYLSDQELSPQYDIFFFNLSFKENTALCALCLNAQVSHPFKPWECSQNNTEDPEKSDKSESKDTKENPELDKKQKAKKCEIKIDEIVSVKSSLSNGSYIKVFPISSTKLMLLCKDDSNQKSVNLLSLDLNNNQTSLIASNIDLINISKNGEWMIIYSEDKLRIGKAGEQFDDSDKSYKNGGIVNFSQNRIDLNQEQEWENILEDAWWLLKNHFWCGEPKNWDKVLLKYKNSLSKVRSREDLNYLIEELIGETGTSHNYILNRGDFDQISHPKQGYLAAEFKWSDNGYEILSMLNVKDFKGLNVLPLFEPGDRMQVGDRILAINGINCKKEVPIEASLSQKGDTKIAITFQRDKKIMTIYPRVLSSMKLVNYRMWVNKNREYVHRKSNGKLGYLHIPDMSKRGFMEFHKGYAQERAREGLVIDNRYNGGGHVSPLIISILMNKQNGAYVMQDQVEEFPDHSNSGQMILLSNQYSGSDGDLFTYQFRRNKLGKVVGCRTWGGVVGISPRYSFIDQGLTAQPEFGIWQEDCEISIENHGVDPDFHVPSSTTSEDDPQLDFAIEMLLKDLPPESIQAKIDKQLASFRMALAE